MSRLSDHALRIVRASGLHRVAKPIARAMTPRWLSLLPANLINDTYFSGFYCIDRLPGGRFLMHRDPTSADLASDGLNSAGGEGLRCFAALLPQVRTLFDIGANTGVFSLMAARRGVPVIHAFEPVPMIHQRLSDNFLANGFANARAHQMALTDRDGVITLYVPMGAMPTEASTREGFRIGTTAVDVRARTLDAFVADQEDVAVDFMKVDTESTEPSVLSGAHRTIERSRPVMLVEVLCGLTEERLHALLDPFDYRYFWITGDGPMPVERIAGDPTYRFLNFLFVPSEKVGRVLATVHAAFGSPTTAAAPAHGSAAPSP